MTREGKEVIYENYVTNDVVVEYEGNLIFLSHIQSGLNFT